MTKEELIEKIAMIVKCDKARTCIDSTACYACEDALERSRKIITIIESEAMHGTIIDELEKMQKWYDVALDWREMEIEKAHKRIQALEASLLDVKNHQEYKCNQAQGKGLKK